MPEVKKQVACYEKQNTLINGLLFQSVLMPNLWIERRCLHGI